MRQGLEPASNSLCKLSLALNDGYSFLYLASARLTGMQHHMPVMCLWTRRRQRQEYCVSLNPGCREQGCQKKKCIQVRVGSWVETCGSIAYILENLIRASGIFDRIEWWTEFNKIKFNWNKCKVLPLGPKGTGVGRWSCVELQFIGKAWGARLSGCSAQVSSVIWLPKTLMWS